MSLDSFPILPYSNNRCVGIHVDVSSIGQKKFHFSYWKVPVYFNQILPSTFIIFHKIALVQSILSLFQKYIIKIPFNFNVFLAIHPDNLDDLP